MKKLVSLLMALALVLTMACGISFAEEKRVLTIGAQYIDNETALQVSTVQKVFEEMGCEVQFVLWDEDSYSAAIAGGDLTDIIVGHGPTSVVLDNNLALNMDPYIEQYAPNLNDGIGATYVSLSREFLSNDGSLYIIPSGAGLNKVRPGTGMDNRGYVVYWDWYEELGCPEINNDDDYISVLQQMKANHPTTEDGKTVYLYGVQPGLSNMGGFAESWKIGQNPWTNYQYKSDVITNYIYDGYLDVENSCYWAEMAFLNRIYQLGEFDMDCFTMTSDEWNAKKDSVQYCGLYKGDNNRGYCPVPSTGAFYYGNADLPLGDAPSMYLYINKNTKNVDLAMTYMNYLYDDEYLRNFYSGEQGETWDYDENGVPYLFESAIASKNSEAEEDVAYWEGRGRFGATTPLTQFTLAKDGYPIDLFKTRAVYLSTQSALELKICAYYGVEYWYDAFEGVCKDYRNDVGEAICSAMPSLSTADQRVIQECEEILTAAMSDLIMSNSAEEFEAVKASVLEEIEETGEADVFVRYQAEWNAIRDKMVPLHNATMEANGYTLYAYEE